jgi:sec-independent protein translocase protein TatA
MIFAKPWADALIVLLVVLLFFGPKRLPALGKSLGEGMREFKDSITGKSSSDEEERAGLEEPAVPVGPIAPGPPPAGSEQGSDPAPESTPVASSEHRA